ncbi:hypothetical protein Ac2012v2_006126 [Leucoagaricus gongylophorus]
MAPVQYTGALQPKKKSELQDIALALKISDQGTKDELQIRIKKHLDDHSELEDDPSFSGLYGRRKRSVQPQPVIARAEPVPAEQRVGRRVGPLEPIPAVITTPTKGTIQVSPPLVHAISPIESTPRHSLQPVSEKVVLPPSSPVSPVKSIIQMSADIAAKVQEIRPNYCGQELLFTLRQYLSDSHHILLLTALYELLYILYLIIPWKNTEVSLSSNGTITVPCIYPPLSTFQTGAFWTVLLHWAVPTVVTPGIIANLISFNPSFNQSSSNNSRSFLTYDPLTASITRLAAHIAYPYSSFDLQSGVYGLDVLGFKFRVWSASLSLAFAFAETISGAPSAFAQTLKRDRKLIATPSRGSTPML